MMDVSLICSVGFCGGHELFHTNFFEILAYRNGWLICTASKSFAVYAATATEKAEWIAHINKCVEDLLRKSMFIVYNSIIN